MSLSLSVFWQRSKVNLEVDANENENVKKKEKKKKKKKADYDDISGPSFQIERKEAYCAKNEK